MTRPDKKHVRIKKKVIYKSFNTFPFPQHIFLGVVIITMLLHDVSIIRAQMGCDLVLVQLPPDVFLSTELLFPLFGFCALFLVVFGRRRPLELSYSDNRHPLFIAPESV